jgi:predicted acetyltransferase
VTIDVRACRSNELSRFLDTCLRSFHQHLREIEVVRDTKLLRPERALAAFDAEDIVGTAGAFEFRLSIPGGEVPTAGVTMVGVLPSHRRRGVMRALMRFQLDDAHERREPVAILLASEDAIYQRFGYGLAADQGHIEVERDRTTWLDDPGPQGKTRLVSLEEAMKYIPAIYDRVREQTPGMFARSTDWWEHHTLPDDEEHRRGAGPMFCAVLEIDGRDEAYALYRVKPAWPEGIPRGRLMVKEAVARSPIAAREIWRFLFGIDLVDRVEAWFLPTDFPIYLMMLEPRRLRYTYGDSLWLRLVDVRSALTARSYATEGSISFEVADPFCPWNEATWRLSFTGREAEVERTEERADLKLDVKDLAAAYLGGFTFARLAGAGRVEEMRAGALARGDAMFRTERAPWCPEIF